MWRKTSLDIISMIFLEKDSLPSPRTRGDYLPTFLMGAISNNIKHQFLSSYSSPGIGLGWGEGADAKILLFQKLRKGWRDRHASR